MRNIYTNLRKKTVNLHNFNCMLIVITWKSFLRHPEYFKTFFIKKTILIFCINQYNNQYAGEQKS